VTIPDYASLHPGYGFAPSFPLPPGEGAVRSPQEAQRIAGGVPDFIACGFPWAEEGRSRITPGFKHAGVHPCYGFAGMTEL